MKELGDKTKKVEKILQRENSKFQDTRIKNIELNRDDSQSKNEICVSMPCMVTVSDTIRCNLNCVMCSRSRKLFDEGLKSFLKRNKFTRKLVKFYSHHRRKTIMDFNLFLKIAKEIFPYLNDVSLSVAGEPFANQNFARQLSIFEEYGVKLQITTNATLMPTSNLLTRLVNNLFRLTVSIDAPTKHSYEAIRRGAHFEKVINNIRRFNLARAKINIKDRPELIFRIVLMRRNIEELPRYIHLVKSLDADAICIIHMIVFDKMLEKESLIHYKQLANNYLKQAKDLIEQFGIKIYEFPPLFNEVSSLERQADYLVSNIPCRFVWSESFIEINGDVYPCCAPNRTGLLMGNVSKQPFREIWNGTLYQSLRRSFKDGNLHPPCKNCYQRLKDNIADNDNIYSV